jgi:hypothetical protein
LTTTTFPSDRVTRQEKVPPFCAAMLPGQTTRLGLSPICFAMLSAIAFSAALVSMVFLPAGGQRKRGERHRHGDPRVIAALDNRRGTRSP